ncbi:MAG: MATE family efflux transporter [Rhodospirillales bacterium]|nr:MATE family efflux transporter [Rhodospirillales bacterium]
MLHLALPTIAVLVVQTLVGVAETYFVSFLGTEALAGVALVFPVLMLMQMMSNGGIGGGVSSAIARALGANRGGDAQALVWHAFLLACGFGLLFTAGATAGGPGLYRAMGGTDETLAAALAYSNIVFAGSVPMWIVALLSSALRGAGDVKTPARITLAGAAILLMLSPALIFGWDPLPRLGIAGAGAAVVIYYVLAAVMLIRYMRSGRTPLKLTIVRPDGRLFGEILSVGLLSAIGTVQVNLTVACVTGVVGLFGADAIAGYGIASRLDYLQIPLLFGLGTAVVTMVGINVGAKQIDRARRIAWTGAAIAVGFTEALGLFVTIFPPAWLGLFSDEPDVLAFGTLYLRTVGPVYGAIALGMMLYFASQGAKRVFWPVVAGTVRMLVAALAGWFAVAEMGADLPTLFQFVAVAALLFGGITSTAMLAGALGRHAPSAATAQADATR